MPTPEPSEVPSVCGWMLLQARIITPMQEPAPLDANAPDLPHSEKTDRTIAQEASKTPLEPL